MGLGFNAVRFGLQGLAWALKQIGPEPGPPAVDPAFWDGPDDLWPREEHRRITDFEPDLIITTQWGLRLPDGTVSWNAWKGTTFAEPIDRVKMIAILQQTALDLGFNNDQIPTYLDYYGWVTRDQLASVVYEDTGTYSLTDPAVSAASAPDSGDVVDSAQDHPAGDLCPRPVGGPA